MPIPVEKHRPSVEAFDEQQFYLDEFRGRTLLFAMPVECLQRETDYESLGAVTSRLLTNDTRVLVLVGVPDASRSDQILRRLQRRLSPLIFRDETAPLFAQRGARAAAFVPLAAAAFSAPDNATALLSNVWSTLRRGPLFVGAIAGAGAGDTIQFATQVAVRLRVHKLVLVDADDGIAGADGKQLSFLDEKTLTTLLEAGQAEWAGLATRRPIFEVVRTALLSGVSSVNLCTLAGMARELFTYEGSGTLFTSADYCTIQRLGIDDFEEVERLIERGQREGLLKPRAADEVASMLVNGYGATIGAHHLAGICALST